MSTPSDNPADPIRRALEHYRRDNYETNRAIAINAARAAGWTWKAIAAELGMSEHGVIRAPGVDSPWNRDKGLFHSPDQR